MPIPLLPFAMEEPVSDFPALPLWGWAIIGAGFYTSTYWLKASRQGRSPKALGLRMAVTFFGAAAAGVPAAWFACRWAESTFPLAKSNDGALPLLAAVIGSVGHKLLNLAGERVLGWAKAEGATALKGQQQP